MQRTRIVATIGPQSLDPQLLRKMHAEGMSVARLNGSHADLEWHASAIRMLRDVLPDIPILLDIPGRKIRTLQLPHEPRFEKGETITLTTNSNNSDSAKIGVNYDDLHKDLTPGNTILADDGTLRFTVLEVKGHDIVIRAETAGQLKSRKGINVPFVELNTPTVIPRDETMIEFAKSNGVDFIGLSFVESAQHVETFRALIGENVPWIVAKVENQGGMNHVREIAEAADAIMIDRGDLSVETSLHDVALRQKEIIKTAREFGKPVIVATEMLHTMITNPFPTKAEVSDITNAVLDGCAATMLSGETAIGDFPLETIALMRDVCLSVEGFMADHAPPLIGDTTEVPAAVANAITTLSSSVGVNKIVAITRSGFAARMIAARSTTVPIIAVSDDKHLARCFNLIGGTTGYYSPKPFERDSTDHVISVLQELYENDVLTDDDLVLVTGLLLPADGARMNTIQIHNIGSVASNLNW